MKVSGLIAELNITYPQFEQAFPELGEEISDSQARDVRAFFASASLPVPAAKKKQQASLPPSSSAPKPAPATDVVIADLAALAKQWEISEVKAGQIVNITVAAFQIPKQSQFDDSYLELLQITRAQVCPQFGGTGDKQPNEFIQWAQEKVAAASSQILEMSDRQSALEESEALGQISEIVADVSAEMSEVLGQIEWDITEQLSDLIAHRLNKSRLFRASVVKGCLKASASDRKSSALGDFSKACRAAILPPVYTADIVIAALNGR